ncbi:MAG: hypothetical protein ABSH26_09690 [Opitutaceae bacterium]|jgi:hypothetical protein
MAVTYSNPKAVAEAGEKIYSEKFKAEYEKSHLGEFVVINVLTGTASLGKTAEEAIGAASALDPAGIFHMMRVGFPSAFQVSYLTANAGPDWLS